MLILGLEALSTDFNHLNVLNNVVLWMEANILLLYIFVSRRTFSIFLIKNYERLKIIPAIRDDNAYIATPYGVMCRMY